MKKFASLAVVLIAFVLATSASAETLPVVIKFRVINAEGVGLSTIGYPGVDLVLLKREGKRWQLVNFGFCSIEDYNRRGNSADEVPVRGEQYWQNMARAVGVSAELLQNIRKRAGAPQSQGCADPLGFAQYTETLFGEKLTPGEYKVMPFTSSVRSFEVDSEHYWEWTHEYLDMLEKPAEVQMAGGVTDVGPLVLVRSDFRFGYFRQRLYNVSGGVAVRGVIQAAKPADLAFITVGDGFGVSGWSRFSGIVKVHVERGLTDLDLKPNSQPFFPETATLVPGFDLQGTINLVAWNDFRRSYGDVSLRVLK